MRHALVALASTTVIVGAAGCGTSSTTNQTVTVTATPTSAVATPAPTTTTTAVPATTSAAPVAEAPTREPCALLTPELATAATGEHVQQQFSLDSDPPLPVQDGECFYKGATRSAFFSINPLPTDPTAPVNHFHVIRPENRIPDVAYEAYWFAAGESLVVVKDGLLLEFKVLDSSGVQFNKAVDIKLANEIVPRVG